MSEEILSGMSPGDCILGTARFTLDVYTIAKAGAAEDETPYLITRVEVGRDENDDEPPFIFFMGAAEYMTAIAARKSGAGYERAVELIGDGSMTYRHMRETNDLN